MGVSTASIVPLFVPTALAASQVGTWRCAPATGLMHGDAIMASLLGFSAASAQAGIPLSLLRETIHPDDREMFDRKNAAVVVHGGVVVSEYRVVPRPGTMRRLLVRGRYDRMLHGNNDNGCVGHGIAIDITDTKACGHLAGETFYAVAARDNAHASPLIRTADLALALHREAMSLEQPVPGLREAIEVALHLVGRGLATDL